MAGQSTQVNSGLLPAASGKSIAEVSGKGGGSPVAPVMPQNLANSAPPKYGNSGLSRYVGNMDKFTPPAQPVKTFAPQGFAYGLTGKPASAPGVYGSTVDTNYSNEGGGRGQGGGTDATTSSGGSQFGGLPGFGSNNGLNTPGMLDSLGLTAGKGAAIGSLFGGLPGMALGGLAGYLGDPSKQGGYAGVAAQGDIGIDSGGMNFGPSEAGYQGDIGYDAGYGGGYGGDGYGSDAGGYGDSGGYGGDGEGSDAGGWAKGGMVTKGKLVGPNPKGKDDGYGALDVGEAVIPASRVKKLGKKKVRKLIGRAK